MPNSDNSTAIVLIEADAARLIRRQEMLRKINARNSLLIGQVLAAGSAAVIYLAGHPYVALLALAVPAAMAVSLRFAAEMETLRTIKWTADDKRIRICGSHSIRWKSIAHWSTQQHGSDSQHLKITLTLHSRFTRSIICLPDEQTERFIAHLQRACPQTR